MEGVDREQRLLGDPDQQNPLDIVFDEGDNVENVLLKNCNYIDAESFSTENHEYKNKFTIYSNNIRSLPNKWNEFLQTIDEFRSKGFKFSVISLQEI